MSVATLYRRFREPSPFMLVGRNAELAMSAARTLERWNTLENERLVKIEAEYDPDPDASFYDTWEHLSERTRAELKERYYENCYVVSTYYRCPHCNEWVLADSISGCAGYDNPCSPFENCYVIEMMQAAIDKLTA